MIFWNRQATLQIGSDQYYLEDLNFSFEVPFEDREELTTSTIEVVNLSETKRNSIANDQQIIVNAGYKDNVGVIFVGEISNYEHKQEPLNWKTKILATDSMEEWLSSKINKPYNEGIFAEDIIRDLTNELGVEIGEIQLAENKQYSRGRSCVSKLKDVLIQISVNECKSRLLIQHGQIYITDPSDPVEQGYLLMPETGLLKENAEQKSTEIETGNTTHKTKEEEGEDSYSRKFTSLLNYNLKAGDHIKVKNKNVDGEFKIIKGVHKGAYNGDYITSIEVKEV